MKRLQFKYEGGLAERLLPALAGSANMKTALEEETISPRQIASLACDIAQAFNDEAIAREWLVEIKDGDVP